MIKVLAIALALLWQHASASPVDQQQGAQSRRSDSRQAIASLMLPTNHSANQSVLPIVKRQFKTNHFPKIKQYVTTHDPKTGKAIFSKAVPEDIDTETFSFNPLPMTHLWTTETFPVDFARDADLDVEAQSRRTTLPESLVNAKGSVLRLVDFPPASLVPPLMHRTVSLDYAVVLEGQVELILDSGEKRMMNRGDIGIQRGTMHAWRNASPDQWCRVLFVLQASKPVVVAGRTLGQATGNVPGIEIPF